MKNIYILYEGKSSENWNHLKDFKKQHRSCKKSAPNHKMKRTLNLKHFLDLENILEKNFEEIIF